MNRYVDCDESLAETLLNVVEERFPSYINLKVKLIFDLKKRIKNGAITLASIEMTNDKIKFFSKDNVAVDGYDYVLIVDKKAWELSDQDDRARLISHELQHIEIDEKGNPKLRGHELEDFYDEVARNTTKPSWKRDLAVMVEASYDLEKEPKTKYIKAK